MIAARTSRAEALLARAIARKRGVTVSELLRDLIQEAAEAELGRVAPGGQDSQDAAHQTGENDGSGRSEEVAAATG